MYSNRVSPFRVDIVYQGETVGSPVDILSVNDVKRLDQIGTLSFSMPSHNELTQYLVSGTYFNVYDEVDGFLGTFLFKSKSISDQSGLSITRVDCYDVLKELTFETVGFNRLYEQEPVSDVIDDLVSIYPGWTTSIENGLNDTTIDFQGESILRAIDEQRDRNIAHYRLGGVRQLEFGYFGDVSEVVFTQLRGVDVSEYENNPNIAIITQITIQNETDEIYNRIIPLGFGQGVSQLTIERATLGDYDTEIGLNADGSNYYYIEDSDSVTQNGRRTRVLSLPNLRALDNNDQNIINAANALKLTAESYLSKHLQPSTEYSITINSLRKPLNVGQLIRVQYKGITNQFKYIDVDDYFYVMDISRNRDVTGKRSFDVMVSSVDVRRTSDQDVMLDVVRDLRTLNVRIPATLAYSVVGAYVKRIKGDTDIADRVNPVFTVRIRDEVLYLNRAILRFATSPLKSSVRTTASGGGSVESSAAGGDHNHIMFSAPGAGVGSTLGTTSCADNSAGIITVTMGFVGGLPASPLVTFESSGDHTHDITIPTHNHAMNYDVFENTVYPQNLKILIDSVDYTNTLLEQVDDSFFAPTNTDYEYELDITSILIQNGLKQNHQIEFYSETNCSGEIEFEVDMLVTIQPIRID